MGNCFGKNDSIDSEYHPIYYENRIYTIGNSEFDRSNPNRGSHLKIPRYFHYDFDSEHSEYESDEIYEIDNKTEPLIPAQNIKYANSLTIVLDLDETLINGRFSNIQKYSVHKGSDIGLLIRPYALELIYTLKKIWNAEIVIWSSGIKYYVLSVLDYILLGKTDIVDHIIWRDDRWFPNNVGASKDLRMLGRDMSKLIFIDNDPMNTIANPHNSIMVPDFDNTVLYEYLNPKVNLKNLKVNTDIVTGNTVIDFGILNENLTTDATLLHLISVINRIHRIVLKTGMKNADVRTIIHNEYLNKKSFIRKWDVKEIKNEYLKNTLLKSESIWCYRIDKISIEEYIDLIKIQKVDTKIDNEYYLIRFDQNDYRLICETLQLFPLRGGVIDKIVENLEPLSPIRSHMVINPSLLEDKYHKIYPESIYYISGIDIKPNQVDEYFDFYRSRAAAIKLYGTF